jgi:hypothetical protein
MTSVLYAAVTDVLQQAQLPRRLPGLRALLGRWSGRPRHAVALQETQLARSEPGRWAHGAFPGGSGGRPALTLILKEAGRRLRCVGRQECGRCRRHWRWCRLRLGWWFILSPLENARGDRRFDRGRVAWSGARRRGFQGGGGFERLDARDDLVHYTDGRIGDLLGVAGQGRLKLVTKPRQLVEVANMGEGSAQTCFVVPQLALGDPQVSHGLLVLRRSAGDEALDGVEDRAGAVKVPRELGIPCERSCHVHLRHALRMEHETKGQATRDA